MQARAVWIHPRRTTEGDAPSAVLVSFDKHERISSLSNEIGPLASYTLEPELLTIDAAMKGAKNEALSYQAIPPTMARAMWRCVTCVSSWASTDANSSRLDVIAIRPRCTPT